jgi:hypothetical protein
VPSPGRLGAALLAIPVAGILHVIGRDLYDGWEAGSRPSPPIGQFDRLLVATVQRAFPPHEHEQLVAHYRGLLGAWANDQRATAGQA